MPLKFPFSSHRIVSFPATTRKLSYSFSDSYEFMNVTSINSSHASVHSILCIRDRKTQSISFPGIYTSLLETLLATLLVDTEWLPILE